MKRFQDLRQPPPIAQKDIDKDRAVADCLKYGVPSPSVDHSNHYKPNPYACTKQCGGDRQCATCTDYSPPVKEKE